MSPNTIVLKSAIPVVIVRGGAGYRGVATRGASSKSSSRTHSITTLGTEPKIPTKHILGEDYDIPTEHTDDSLCICLVW